MIALYNARIYTQNKAEPFVTALLIENDQVVLAGSDNEILAAAGSARKIDLRGKTILPGLTDSHMHLGMYAQSLNQVDCETATMAECLARIAEKAKTIPASGWVLGFGWNQNVWDGGFGNAEDLDRVTMGKPAYFYAKSGHAAWANSLAMKMAGITSSTPDPEGGQIQRDSTGKPTGIFFEENAMGIIDKLLPVPTVEDSARMILEAQKQLWQVGVTGVHDYDGPLCFSALQLLDKEDKLRLRVNKGIPLAELPNAIKVGLRSGFGSDFVWIGSIKCFSDGALGPQTAAMLQPYENTTSETGILLMDAEQLFELGQDAVRNGLSVTVHAIGDRANHEILNGYSQLRAYERQIGAPKLRHRIEHVQVLHPDDLIRLAELDIIASMQPLHATSDMFIADKYWGSRSMNAYAPKTLLKNGTHLAFGSDAPVESPNPFWGLHAAVTRRRMDGTPGEDGWYPGQRLTLQEALDAYTTGAAYASGHEHNLGQLAHGFFADLLVLENDPFNIPAQELYQQKPLATMVAGDWVYNTFSD